MAVEAVDRKSDELAVELGELVFHRREGHELGGADRGEVGWVGEKDDPFAGVVGGKVDLPLRGDSRKRGRWVANAGHGSCGGRLGGSCSL